MFLLATLAFAADSTFTGATTSGAVPNPLTTTSAELGGTWISGNTQSYSITATLRAAHRWDKNQAAAVATAALGRSAVDTDADGILSDAEKAAPPVETARRYGVDARYDRWLGAFDTAYGLAGATADPFAGYDVRAHVQAGWSHSFRPPPTLALLGELGVDVALEDFVEGVEPQIAWVYAARVMVKLAHTFNPSVSAELQIEALDSVVNPLDVRVLGSAALVAKIDTRLAVRLGTVGTWDNVPVEGYGKWDQTTTVTLVATVQRERIRAPRAPTPE